MAVSGARKTYKNPPIEEALVEYRFTSGQDWDLTIPGKLHEKLKDSYPGKPRQQKLLQATVQAVPGQAPDFALHEGIGRVQLVDLAAQRLLSLGPNVLSVNVLRPYDGWTKFRPRIEAALRAYVEVSGAEKIGRIGVRYINKVVIPTEDLELREYFRCGPAAPDGLPKQLGGFLNRAEHLFEDGIKLLLTFASMEMGPSTSTFLLDLDVIWERDIALDVDGALRMTDDLHEREGSAFEAVITGRTREVFDAS